MIVTTKDGRILRDGKDYTAFRRSLYDAQEGRCAECGRYTSLELWPEDPNSFHVHHRNGRGLGGGKRTDTLEACEGLCFTCHIGKHD